MLSTLTVKGNKKNESTTSLSYDTDRIENIENDASNNSSIAACVCYRGNVSTKPLPSNDRGTFTEPLPSNNKGIFNAPLPNNDKGDTQTHIQTEM
jgi:hypothetical protein